MQFLKAHWPAIAAVLGAAVPYLIPALQGIVAAYPKSTVGVLCAAIIAAYYASSPKDAPKPPQ